MLCTAVSAASLTNSCGAPDLARRSARERHAIVTWNLQAYGRSVLNNIGRQEERTMDDYLEELLDAHALDHDPAEPAEDATEL